MKTKSLNDISLQISEEEYRNDGCLHYSKLAKYERGGFEAIPTLDEKLDTPSLLFGSLVDCLITGTPQELEERFLIAEFPTLEPLNLTITKAIFNIFKDSYNRLSLIPDSAIITMTESHGYQLRWKPETRAKVIKEKCEEYYSLLRLAETKTIVDTKTYEEAVAAAVALRESEATKWYFEKDNPFEEDIERVYQPKFKATIDDVNYSCMLDLVVVDHKNKLIYPCDLKTSGHPEYKFFESFINWSYYIQASQYSRILEEVIKQDEYFKDFKIMPYRFIVVNRKTLTPLVWEWNQYCNNETLEIKSAKGKTYTLRNFREIGKELQNYIDNEAKVPDGIKIIELNSIKEWLEKN